MPNENEQQTQTETEVDTQVEQTPEQVAEAQQIADISELFDLPEPKAGDETKNEDGTSKEVPPKTEVQAKPEGGKEEQKNAPAPKPGEEAPKSEVKEEGSLKDILKEVLAETRKETPLEDKKEPPKKEGEEGPKYTPAIPDELHAAMEHEDPKVRKQAMSIMVGGAMNKVYSDLKKEMAAQIQSVVQNIPAIMQQRESAAQEAEKMRKDFYEENPNFGGSPKKMQLVAQVAIQLASSLGENYKGFTPEFRAELAKNLEEMTGIKAGKPVAAPANPNTPKKEVKKPGFQTGGSPARGEVQPTLADEIFDVIGSAVN